MSPFGWQIRVQSSVVCRLLDRGCGPGSHREPIPREDTFMGLKGSHSSRLIVKWNRPERVCCVRLEIEVPVMELLDLVGGQRQRAWCRLETRIDERIHRDPIRRRFRRFERTWVSLGNNH